MPGGILVVAEHLKGEITEITYEMLGIGRTISDALNLPLYCLISGKEVTSLTPYLGCADTIFIFENPQLEVPAPDVTATLLKNIVETQNISLVILGGTNASLGVGAKLSNLSHLPFINFCKNIRVENSSLVITTQLFGGKILADIRLPDNRGIVSVVPGSFPLEGGKRDRISPVERLGFSLAPSPIVFRNFIEPGVGDVDITKQDILVAVGRGIQSQDNIRLAEELAELLGGAVCASRPIVDQGWLPLTRQVGKSGMTVKPKLYLALGISGAPEHQEGMKNSQCIIAINTDANAPIFNIAHFGAVADIFEVIPSLIEEVKKRKGKG